MAGHRESFYDWHPARISDGQLVELTPEERVKWTLAGIER
jgi:hypothetical protein